MKLWKLTSLGCAKNGNKKTELGKLKWVYGNIQNRNRNWKWNLGIWNLKLEFYQTENSGNYWHKHTQTGLITFIVQHGLSQCQNSIAADMHLVLVKVEIHSLGFLEQKNFISSSPGQLQWWLLSKKSKLLKSLLEWNFPLLYSIL